MLRYPPEAERFTRIGVEASAHACTPTSTTLTIPAHSGIRDILPPEMLDHGGQVAANTPACSRALILPHKLFGSRLVICPRTRKAPREWTELQIDVSHRIPSR